MTSRGPFWPKSTQIKRLDKAVEMSAIAIKIEWTYLVIWEEAERGKLKKWNKRKQKNNKHALQTWQSCSEII